MDRLRADHDVATPAVDAEVVAALAAGDVRRLGAALVNDLQPAAIAATRPAGDPRDRA